MKERQRWQPEEDALLRAYVKQYGPKEWNLVSQRMGKPLDRDPKSCLERWKNYLKPGIKKGSLSPEEQSLVISLQAKYGNKWKKIAAEVPGRTAKRLGKWWEVFKEKQLKAQQQKSRKCNQIDYGASPGISAAGSSETAAPGKYDHILETFAEKYVQPKLLALQSSASAAAGIRFPDPPPMLSPPWMSVNLNAPPKAASSLTTSSSSTTQSPSVSLTLSPSEPAVLDPVHPERDRFMNQIKTLIQHCKELEEGRENFLRHKKEAAWRLSRLEQQLESEKARRQGEATAATAARIRMLREEAAAYVSRMEGECREEVKAVQREAEEKEGKLMGAWSSSHVKLGRILERMGAQGGHGCSDRGRM